MARIGGAGLSGTGTSTDATGISLSRQQFRTIAWLRWRIFVNALRGKGAMGELVVKIISYPVLGAMIFGPAVGAGFGSFYFVHQQMDAYLAIPLWIVFLLWQFIGVSTSTTAPSFDLTTLVRFPLRYRDYLLMRLSFGIMDPPTLAGIACLLGMSAGLAIAAPTMLPWAGTAFAVYAACNVLFSRMIYSWLERWLAQRRTRELVTGLIVAASLGFQFIAQFAQKLGMGQRAASPFMLKTAHILIAANWLLPPGLTASAIDQMHRGNPLIGVAAFAGLLAFTVVFLLVLHLRLHAQYLGENLSEAPSAATSTKKTPRKPAIAAAVRPDVPERTDRTGWLPPGVMACLIKEIRYLLRSGPKLYVLVMPVFVLFLFSMRNSGLSAIGMSHGKIKGLLFCYGCAYMQLIFVGLVYNSLGGDGAGVQFYFLAPLRLRDVMVAKNLLTGGIMTIELLLMYGVTVALSSPPPVAVAAATVAWCAFTLMLNMSIGNVRSITSPKGTDPNKVRSQSVNGVSSLISIVVSLAAIGLGIVVFALCSYLDVSLWAAAIVFLVLAALGAGGYLLVLNRIDGIGAENVEHLTRELSKYT
jgi:ABC-2 type transport system permease protein